MPESYSNLILGATVLFRSPLHQSQRPPPSSASSTPEPYAVVLLGTTIVNVDRHRARGWPHFGVFAQFWISPRRKSKIGDRESTTPGSCHGLSIAELLVGEEKHGLLCSQTRDTAMTGGTEVPL